MGTFVRSQTHSNENRSQANRCRNSAMALMQVDVSTELDCPAIKAWSEVQKSALLVTSVLCENGYFRTEFTSKLVNLFMGGIEFSYDDQYPCLSKVKFNISPHLRW